MGHGIRALIEQSTSTQDSWRDHEKTTRFAARPENETELNRNASIRSGRAMILLHFFEVYSETMIFR